MSTKASSFTYTWTPFDDWVKRLRRFQNSKPPAIEARIRLLGSGTAVIDPTNPVESNETPLPPSPTAKSTVLPKVKNVCCEKLGPAPGVPGPGPPQALFTIPLNCAIELTRTCTSVVVPATSFPEKAADKLYIPVVGAVKL